MAVNIVSSPDTYALTKGGRMSFRFAGSGRLATLGTNAVHGFLITGAVPDGTKVALRWNGKTVIIYARTAPSAANEFLAGDGSAAYCDAILPFFQEFFPIREDFTVIRGNDFGSVRGFSMTAKQAGTAYKLTGSATASTVEISEHTAGADPLLRPNYSIYLELWSQQPGSTEYVRSHVATINTGDDGSAEYDVGDVLHPLLQSDNPAWGYQQPYGGYYSHRKYYICYGEAFGSPLQAGRIKKDTTRHAYLGGADYEHRAGNGLELSTFVQTGATAPFDRALRFGPRTRYVRYNEPQFLTFVNTRATVAGLLLNVYLKFGDGTDLSVNDIYAAQLFTQGDKLTYAVGPAQLDLASLIPEGKSLTEYYVKLRTTSADYSLQYRFVINLRHDRHVRYFAFLNSLGCLDTLATFGKGSRELARFYEQAERFTPTGYDVQQGQFTQYDQAVQLSEEVTTGFRGPAELEGFTDFYRSPERYRLLEKAGVTKALPIGLSSKSIKGAKDDDTLHAHSFQFAYLYKNDFYTADESDELLGDGNPPPGFVPGGSITIQQPQVVNARDESIDDAVRALNTAEINKFKAAHAWGNHAIAGYLTQASGDQLYEQPYDPVEATTTNDLPAGSILTWNPVTGKNELLSPDQVAQFIGGLAKVLKWGNLADRDIRMSAEASLRMGADDGTQTGMYFTDADGVIRAFIGYRANGTLAFQDVKNNVAITTEPDGTVRVNGWEIITRANFPALTLDQITANGAVALRAIKTLGYGVFNHFQDVNSATHLLVPILFRNAAGQTEEYIVRLSITQFIQLFADQILDGASDDAIARFTARQDLLSMTLEGWEVRGVYACQNDIGQIETDPAEVDPSESN